MDIKLGQVYKTKWDGNIARVIGFDNFEVFYDGFWPHDNSWTFASNLNKKCSFYRAGIKVFLEKVEKVEFKELTVEEFNIFRPDLVMRLGRLQNLSWNDDILESEFTLEEFGRNQTELNFDESIESDKVWLYPYGSKGGLKKGELLEAKNGKCFNIKELLIIANKIQKKENLNKSNGIGIYRDGIQRQIPSYYIGEYIDLAGIMK